MSWLANSSKPITITLRYSAISHYFNTDVEANNIVMILIVLLSDDIDIIDFDKEIFDPWSSWMFCSKIVSTSILFLNN